MPSTNVANMTTEELKAMARDIASTTTASCMDVTKDNDPLCYGNVTWAMQTGIKEHPLWYAEYPILSIDSSFKAFQFVLANKVGPGPLARDGNGWQCPHPCDMEVPECFDVTEDSPGECYSNTMWAKDHGINEKPEWYEGFPTLAANSSFVDFQYVLHKKNGPGGDGPGWECPKPCTVSLVEKTMVAAAAPPPTTVAVSATLAATSTTTATTTTTTTTTVSDAAVFPWWAMVLLALLGVGILAAAVMYFMSQSAKKSSKKKRSRALPAAPAPSPASAPEQAQALPAAYAPATSIVAPPVYTAAAAAPITYTAAPVQVRAVPMAQPVEPVQMQAQSLQMMQPVQMTPQPVEMMAQPVRTQPVQIVAQPVRAAPPPVAMLAEPVTAAAGQPGAMSLFDQLDANHDGVITRAEFARLS